MAQVSNQSIQPVYARRLPQPPRRGRTPVLVSQQRLAIPNELLTTVAPRTSEVTLNRLLQATKILVWEAEAEAESWRFTYVGKQAKEMLGYPITDWYEPDFLDLHLHPEDKNQILSQRHADQYDLTFRMIASDGRVVWFHNLISVTSRYGKTRRMSGFMIDISERKRTEENLTDLSGRLIAAQEKERSRIACELHDDFNQRLALLSIELEQLGETIPRVSDNCQLLQKIQRQIQEISADMHRLSYRLHPSKLDHLGLAAAFKSLCEEVSKSGKLEIEFQEHGFPAALEKDTALCLFRVAQEALRNSVKHSGAQSVRVLLWKTINAVRVSVADDGNGFDPGSEVRRSGLGFISMRERVQTVGGQMQIHSQPQRGTCISVSVPLRGDLDPVIKNDLKTGLKLQEQKQQEATPLLRAVKSRELIRTEDIMKPPSVILADDHPLIMDALRNLLEPEFEIVAMFTDGQSLIKAAPTLNPNVIVLDIGMPIMNGLSAGERLKKLMPRVKLVYLTQNQDQDIAKEAFRFGASAYVVKTSPASDLIGAIREAVRGGFYVSPLVTKGIVGPVMHAFKRGQRKNRLTLRQKEVLQLLAEGHSMKGAAFILNLSPRTVAYHKYTMMDHLSIRSSAELIEYAMKRSLVAV